MRRAACQPPAALAPKLFIHDHAPAEIAPRPWRAQHTTSVHAVRKLRDPHMQNNCYGGGSGGTPCQGPQALMPKKTPPYAMRPCPPMASTLSVAGHPLPANVNACPHLGRLVRLGRPGRARAPQKQAHFKQRRDVRSGSQPDSLCRPGERRLSRLGRFVRLGRPVLGRLPDGVHSVCGQDVRPGVAAVRDQEQPGVLAGRHPAAVHPARAGTGMRRGAQRLRSSP
jgi:hypothetical protein